MKKLIKISSLLVMLVTFAAAKAYADNSFFLNPAALEPGTEDTLELALDNSDTFYGFSAEVTLPPGLEFVKNSEGKAEVSLNSSRAGSTYQLVTNIIGNKLLMAAFSSKPGTAISGSSGTLVKIKVTATTSYHAGNLTISNIIFVNANDGDVGLNQHSSQIGVLPNAIKLSPEEVTISKPDTYTLDATFIPDWTTVRDLTWESSEPSVASVSAAGVVKAEYRGEAIITATSKNGKTATSVITALLPALGLELDRTEISIAKGTTDKLIATPDPEETTDDITWESSNEAIATVDDNGTVTAVARGEAVITARCGSQSASCNVTVFVLPVSIDMQETAQLKVGDAISLTATVLPYDTNDKTVTWSSSDESIATVDADGNVTGIALGEVTITATCTQLSVAGETVKAVCEVKVVPTPVESIELDPTTAELKVGESITLATTVLPEDATDKTVKWKSSDRTIATVNTDGVVTAVALGEVTITATSGNWSATCAVTVVPTPVESVTIEPAEAQMMVGQNMSLTAIVKPDDATDKTTTWTSSNPAIVAVDSEGNITALALGEATITATAEEHSGTCLVTVVPTPAESVTVTPATAELKVGQGMELKATVLPDDTTDKTVVWTSSNPDIVAVDAEGKILAKALGEATITATCGAKDGSCVVTVVPTPAESITLDPTSAILEVTDVLTISAVVKPDDATFKDITWKSSNETVATVDATGKVTALALGEVAITASCGDVNASCVITVVSTPAQSITLSAEDVELRVGQTFTLTETVLPESTTDKRVSWSSSNEAIATVDSNGNLTALALGETTITVTCGDVTATCKVTVVPTPVTGISLTNTSLLLKVGNVSYLDEIIEPADATDPSVVWRSADELIATVDQEGNVTAIAPGKTVVTVTSVSNPEISATCEVTVESNIVEVTSITINESSIELIEGDTFTLVATVLPADATDSSVTWSSSDPSIATVSDTGVVTALSAGRTIIYASSSNGLSATCAVTVIPRIVEPNSLTLSNTELFMTEGETADIIPVVGPDNANNKTVTWSSSNEEIATVDANGIVTAKKAGQVIITASTYNNITAICNVTVIPAIVAVNGISVTPKTLDLTVGDDFTLSATITPADATDKTVTWKTSAQALASVSQTGEVKALAAGEAMIFASSSNGLTDTCTVTIRPVIVKVTEISIPSSMIIMEGQVAELVAIISPADATDRTLIWTSSDTSIATVDGDGNVTGVKQGETTVTVSSPDGVSATCTVTVLPNFTAVAGISLNEKTLDMLTGETFTLVATITPEDATDKTVTWKSSDRAIATVDETGVVTAVSAGRALIFASSSNGLTDTCTVTVRTPIIKVSEIKIPSELMIFEGEFAELAAIIIPADATDHTLSFESADTSIATVDEDGTVTGIKASETTVTVTSPDGISATCAVTVIPKVIAVEGISLNEKTLDMTVGDGFTLIATITPEDATDKTITWASLNSAVASVDNNGFVTAIAAGETLVFASSSNGLTDTCTVTVRPLVIDVTGISIPEVLQIKEGATAELIATVTPADATDKTVTWSINDTSIATVDANGIVTALKVGEAVITATAASGVSATCALTVLPIPVTGISLNEKVLDMTVGDEFALFATITPDNATYKTVTWETSNGSIATVSNDGLVTAIAPGEIKVFASSSNGLTDICTVTVKPRIIKVTEITIPSTLIITEGQSAELAATITPAEATDHTLNFESADTSVATVDEDGTVTGVKVGETTVTVTSPDGVSATCTVTVIPIAVESISLNENTLEMTVGGEFTLVATITPENATDKTVTWASLNSTIASVNSDGVVTAISPGEVKIFASSSNGLTDICTVTVVPGIVPVTGISLSNTELLMKVGRTTNLVEVIEPVDATDKRVTWRSTDESIATVDQKGNVTSVKAGVTTIIVTSVANPSVSAICTVTVEDDIVAITDISLNKSTLTLTVGDDYTLTATITPDNATDKTVTWQSSNPAIATVSENGVVTAISQGEVQINASSSNGKTAVCTVTVLPGVIDVTGIAISNTELTMREGHTAELFAFVQPADADDQTVVWTTEDEAVATVNQNGIVTAIKQGVTRIIVSSANGVQAICTVTVIPYVITDISLNETAIELEIGDNFELKATITPDDVDDKTVTWSSSDPTIATVDENGNVTAVSTGQTTVFATTVNGLMAKCVVTVVRGEVEVTGIAISNSELTLREGRTAELFAFVQPADADDLTVVWTSEDEAVATVDQNGIVTAIRQGVTRIIVRSANGVKAICTVTVIPYVITDITLNETAIELEIGDNFELKATITPDDVDDKTVTWSSSDPTIATVDENGNVTAVSTGQITVFATTVNGLMAKCVVTVVPGVIDVTGISISNTELTMREGHTAELIAIVQPADADDQSVVWTSEDEAVATVDQNGIVTAIKQGVTRIIVSSANGVKAICIVTVIPYPITDVTLNETAIEIEVGETFDLIATVTPDDVDDKTITWNTSDPAIATVSETGQVTGVSVGVTTAFATTVNGLTAKCIVTVVPGEIEVTGISLSNTELTMREGRTAELIAIVRPADADDQNVRWTTDDEAVATVDQNGIVTAVKQGVTNITASSANGVKAVCVVTVIPYPITDVTLNESAIELEVGDNFNLIATVVPDDVDDKTITWQTSDPSIATVSNNGLVIAISVGEATIYATTVNGLTAKCVVTVIPDAVDPTGIALSNTELLMREGHTSELIAIVYPYNADDKSVTWATDRENIATVDQNGIVTAIKQGIAIITATTVNGLTAECVVTVIPDVVAVTGISLNKHELEMTEGDDFTLVTTITPEDATDKTVTWLSSNVAVATVSDSGEVKAVSAGFATIYASSSNGLTDICEVTVYPLIIEVIAISLDPAELILWQDESATLTVTILPEDATDKTITWISNNPEIATVEDGVVTGLKPGIATITAKSTNGQTAFCAVTVKERPFTPRQLLKKGDGTTCTFVVMMDLTDAELAELGYRYVVGYTTPQGETAVIADTPLRYCHTIADIYNNAELDFWVFAYIINNEGSMVNSNLRHLDGSEEICVDAQGYLYGSKGTGMDAPDCDDWIQTSPAGLHITAGGPDITRVAIFNSAGAQMYGKTYPAGVPADEIIMTDQFVAGTYVVVVACCDKVKSKKIVVR